MNTFKDPIPNFLILGAQKSGTTSLYKYLEAQEDIFMSSPLKEPGFFWGSTPALQYWNRKGKSIYSLDQLLKEYMLKGYSGERYFGDASTYYTISNYSRRWHIPKRIHTLQPEMKFIYILRNPFDRLISNYLHYLKNNKLKISLDEFIDSSWGQAALLTSLYHHQLEEYLGVFSPDAFKILIFEDLIDNPAKCIEQTFEFLCLNSSVNNAWHESHNVSTNRSQLNANELILSTNQYQRLSSHILPDTEKLFDFLGRNVDLWDLSESKWCST